jgi:predicted membrane-bound mannosyltransferase
MTASGHRLTVLPKSVTGVATTTVTTVNRMIPSCQTTSASVTRPVMRVPPLNMSLGAQATLGTLVNTVVAGTTTVTTTTTMTSTKTCTALNQPVLAALVHQSQRNNTMHTTSLSVSTSMVTRNETKMAEQRKQKQEAQVETRSVFYLVSFIWYKFRSCEMLYLQHYTDIAHSPVECSDCNV